MVPSSPPSDSPEIQLFRQLFDQSREPTRRTLVEFYESDWETISGLKDQLDLSWKDFFRALSYWFAAVQKNEELREQLATMMQAKESDDQAGKRTAPRRRG